VGLQYPGQLIIVQLAQPIALHQVNQRRERRTRCQGVRSPTLREILGLGSGDRSWGGWTGIRGGSTGTGEDIGDLVQPLLIGSRLDLLGISQRASDPLW
jgi:hypothetical protein